MNLSLNSRCIGIKCINLLKPEINKNNIYPHQI